MRLRPVFYRLSFMLPRLLVDAAIAGVYRPNVDGCKLVITRAGIVTITGPSREHVFDHARLLLRTLCKDMEPFSIAARLETPLVDRFGRPFPRRDGWSVIVNADVAFSPTSLPADVNNTTRFG